MAVTADWSAVLDYLARQTGVDPEAVGKEQLLRCVRRQAEQADCRSAAAFIAMLRNSESLRLAAYEAFSVAETWFFRGQEAMRLLPDLVRNYYLTGTPGKKVRILSFPCSTGEEPYSIAIALAAAGIQASHFSITAADLSIEALAYARQGRYQTSSFRESCPDLQRQFFHRENDVYYLNDDIRSRVEWRHANLVAPDCLLSCTAFQIVFCRNVLIYLTDNGRQRLLASLERLLADEATLFTGNVELNFFQQHGFAPLPHSQVFACRRAKHAVLPDSTNVTGMSAVADKVMTTAVNAGVSADIIVPAAVGKQHIAGNHAASNHAAGNHATSSHATSSHATSSHATSSHAASSHAASSHATSSHATSSHATSSHAASSHAASNHAANNHAVGNHASQIDHAANNHSDQTDHGSVASHAAGVATVLERVRSLADCGQTEAAEKLCLKLVERQPDLADGHFWLGLLRQAHDALHDAEQSFVRALYLNPTHEDALVHLGQLYQHLGRHEQAATCLRRARKVAKRTGAVGNPRYS